ncbi:hypothetical protein [Streptomyces sp. NBC_00140]|uniref:hypothetical protein n=1 Tax=Streptomyces sp. NBC_00140 TaxID=2975664 RepID=UPI002257875A|nr:hypothetical protein [Streptomyces sp. NBC_00140]MCX5328341.1 hypothetical protein [Streptomyces sp. NBC_00140]
MPLRRTYYGNLASGQVIAGNTQHGESLTDMEGYALPMEQARLSALLDPGVADGLQVGAALGQPGLTVGTGLAVDGRGRSAVLAVDGAAVVDQSLPGDQLRNVPTVPVTASGTQLPTDGIDGAQVLSIVAREVLVTGSLGQNPELVHAPWLRLEPASTWTGDDQSVPLATVTLDQAGAVTALTTDHRLIATPVGTSVTRFATATPGQSPVIGQATGGGLRMLADGGLQLVRKAPDGTRVAALTVEAATGDIGLPARLAVGTATPASGLTLHVEGAEVHSGGPGAGFSFMDRQVSGFVVNPAGGQRWVWYAQDGTARLWSGHDQLTVGAPGEGGGLDVPRRMRVRQGADASAGIWLRQNGSGDAAFLGMRDDNHVGMWGTPAGWALVMDVATGRTSTTGSLDVGAGTRADLHVSGDALIGAGSNGALTVRHVNGKAAGHDGDDDLYLNSGTGRGVHVGGQASAPLAVHGNAVVDGDLRAAGGLTLPASGTIQSEGRLHITGGELLYLLNHDGVVIGTAWGGNGNLTVEGRQLKIGSTPAMPAWSGGGLLTLDVFACGALYVGGDFDNPKCVFYADGTKHFVIDHPLDPENKSLHHVCVEGPEAAVFYRGCARLADGWTEVELPPYFEGLARADGRTVMLTPVCDDDAPISVLAASPVRGGRFTVRAADDRNPAQRFCWEVKAVRADVELLAVETAKAGREAIAVS